MEPWAFLMPMPIYEFYCPDNHRIYGFYARTQALAGRVPRCPDNPAFRMVKVPSRFAVTGRHRDKPGAEGGADAGDDPFSRLDDAQMEKLMGEFEGDLGGDQEPDPRTMGRMMRRLSEVAGQPLAGPMAEMVSRMERGEDPEALEAEYGEILDGDPGNLFEAARQSLGKRPPAREPRLFEMAEYVDEGS